VARSLMFFHPNFYIRMGGGGCVKVAMATVCGVVVLKLIHYCL
jgi:hypothetical protein